MNLVDEYINMTRVFYSNVYEYSLMKVICSLDPPKNPKAGDVWVDTSTNTTRIRSKDSDEMWLKLE